MKRKRNGYDGYDYTWCNIGMFEHTFPSYTLYKL